MADPIRWLALGYSVPVNPSKNRVYVWRKLKEYGAEYFKQGVALLPYNRQSYTKFKYLSAKILEMGGEASIVEMKFLDPKDEREVVSRFRTQALEELSQLKQDCAQVLSELKNGGDNLYRGSVRTGEKDDPALFQGAQPQPFWAEYSAGCGEGPVCDHLDCAAGFQ